jgi:hypothetical protein
VALLVASRVVVVGAKPNKYSIVAKAYRFLSLYTINIPLHSF